MSTRIMVPPHLPLAGLAPGCPTRSPSLWDLGSNDNIIGLKKARMFTERAAQFGHALKVMNLSRILYVNGVGAG